MLGVGLPNSCVCGCNDLAKRKSALSYNEVCAACDVNPADAVIAASTSTSRELYLCDRLLYTDIVVRKVQLNVLCVVASFNTLLVVRYGHH